MDSRTAPAVGTVTADTPLQRLRRDRAVPPGTAPRRLAGRRARRAVPSPGPASRAGLEPVDNAVGTRGPPRRRDRLLTRPRRRRPPPKPVEPHRLPAERSAATARATGTDVRGDRPGRSPRSPSSGTGSAPPPPAAMAAVPWRTRRPPPRVPRLRLQTDFPQ